MIGDQRSVRVFGRISVVAPLVCLSLSFAAAKQMPSSPEQRFLTESDAAMDTMMRAMTIKPSGDVDRDFADLMIPHHQGAIDMAIAELRYGHNEQLRRIAQEIVIDQQGEITAMRLAIGRSLPPLAPAPTTPTLPKEE